MTRILGYVILIATVATILILLFTCGPAQTEGTASPSPSPSASAATPTPPASAATVHWALRWRRAAVKSWSTWNRARTCLSLHHRPFASPKPRRSASGAVWTAHGQRWRHLAREYRQRTARLVYRMRNPGGSGAARWWPAARWCGWEAGLKSWFCAIVWRESSARLLAENPSSHCFGLLQEHPCWWLAKHGWAWIRDVFNQLRLGWYIYRVQGPSAWAL